VASCPFLNSWNGWVLLSILIKWYVAFWNHLITKNKFFITDFSEIIDFLKLVSCFFIKIQFWWCAIVSFWNSERKYKNNVIFWHRSSQQWGHRVIAMIYETNQSMMSYLPTSNIWDHCFVFNFFLWKRDHKDFGFVNSRIIWN